MWRHPRSQLLRSRADSSSLCFQSNASGCSEFTSFLLPQSPVLGGRPPHQSEQQHSNMKSRCGRGASRDSWATEGPLLCRFSLSLLLLHSAVYPVTHFFSPQHQSLKYFWILWLSKSMLGKMLKKNHSNYTLRFRKRCSYQCDLKFGNLNKSQ